MALDVTSGAAPPGPEERAAAAGPPRAGAGDDHPAARSGRRRPVPMMPIPLTLGILAFTYWCVDIVTPTVPVIQDDLALSGAGAGLVMSAFFLGRLFTNFPASILIDRTGPRGCALLGAAILCLGSLVAANAPAELPLLVGRATQGAGVALLATAALLSLLRAWPGSGVAMTAFNVSAGIGGGFGLAAGGLITAEFGWRGVFWLCAIIGVLLLVGTVLASTVQGSRRGRPVPDLDESEEAESTVRPALTPGLSVALAANLLVYGNYGIWVVALGLLAAERFGAGPAQLGLLLLVVNATQLLGAVVVGRMIRVLGAPRALGPGLAVAAVAIFAILLAPSFIWLFPVMMLYAIGQIASNTSAGDLVLRLGGGGGRAVGMLRLTSDIGLVVGPALIGVLADVAGIRAPFLALSIITAAGAIATWRLNRRSPAMLLVPG